MRTSNFAKGRRAAGFFRLCLGIIISLTLAMGGTALNTAPVSAIGLQLFPAVFNMIECTPFTYTFAVDPVTCACPSGYQYYLVGTIPNWVHLDQNTGVLTATPPAGSAGIIPPFNIVCSEYVAIPLCGTNWSTPPAPINITVAGGAPPCPLTINPTYYPVAWESMPFYMTLSATGGVGALNWAATGLPIGLTVDPVTGIISGTPGPGTCSPWTVTVTVTDTGGCCPPVSAAFILYVDCWANYLAMITTYSTTSCDFKVNIGPGLTYGKTNVVIDGTLEATLAGNESETFTSVPCENHLVVVDQIIPGPDPNKTRFEVLGSNSKMVSDIDNTAYFDYAQAGFIQTGSDPVGVAQQQGTGWYQFGSNFSTSAPSPVNSDNQQGTKYIFRAWSLPDGSTDPNRDLWFSVNRAGAATARYDTYYLLQLKSDYPPISESSWELKGSTANYDLALQAVPMLGFWGFLGGVLRPVNSSGSHLMDSTYTQKIMWSDDYTVPMIIISVIMLLIIGLVVLLILLRKRAVPAVPAATVAQAPQPPAVAPQGARIAPVVTATPAKKALPEAESKDKPNFCPKCGAPVDKDAEFCKKCGSKLG